jgi:hypothetical protein
LRRALAAVMILWTQVFAVLAPAAFVTCVHDDGRAAIEWIGSECCREAHARDGSSNPAERRGTGPSLAAAPDRCHDLPVRAEQTVVARAGARTEQARSERSAPAAILVLCAPPAFAPAVRGDPTVRGPPPEAVPRPPRRAVLRV